MPGLSIPSSSSTTSRSSVESNTQDPLADLSMLIGPEASGALNHLGPATHKEANGIEAKLSEIGNHPVGPQLGPLEGAATLDTLRPRANAMPSVSSKAKETDGLETVGEQRLRANAMQSVSSKDFEEISSELRKTLDFRGGVYTVANQVGFGKTADNAAREISKAIQSMGTLNWPDKQELLRYIRLSLNHYQGSTDRAKAVHHEKSDKLEGRLAAMEKAYSMMCALCHIEPSKVGHGLSTKKLTDAYEAERYEITVQGSKINIRGLNIKGELQEAIKAAGSGNVQDKLQKVIDGQVRKGKGYAEKLLGLKVEFMTPDEVSKRTVTVKAGCFFQDDGRMKAGKYAFVLSPDGTLLMKEKLKNEDNNGAGNVQHSSFLHAEAVSGAGFITILKDGCVNINNSSGHYQPGKDLVTQSIDSLVRMKMPIEKITVDFTPGGSVGVAVRELAKFCPMFVEILYPSNVPASEFLSKDLGLSKRSL